MIRAVRAVPSRSVDRSPTAAAPPSPSLDLGSAGGVRRLQQTAGNAAVKRVLARNGGREKGKRWFRGQASGVPRTQAGQVVHDLGDGVYYTDSAKAAQGYADLRAADAAAKGAKATADTGGFTAGRQLFGRTLDLTRDPRWAKFLRSKPPVPAMGGTWREYMAKTTEFYNAGFTEFLRQNGIKHTTIGGYVSKLTDYDTVIAEDLIRNPRAKQMVIMNPQIVTRVDSLTKSVHVVTTTRDPAPIGVGGGAGGGRLPDAPRLHVNRSGRVRLYRVVSNAELASIARFGDFNPSPHGGGKYFSFNRTDALALATKSPGGASAYTLVETTVPRSFLPERTDLVHRVQQPHLPARGGAAVMAEGDVIIQVDRQGAGWALHVDDDALAVMNKVASQPKIHSAPSVKSVPGSGSATPPVKPPTVAVEPTPRPTVAPKAPRIGAGVRITIGIGLNVALFALFFWLGKKKAEQMQRDIKRLNKTKIEPAVDSALVAQVAEGDRVNAKDLTKPMYANVTVDWRMEWEESGIGRNRTGETMADASFVGLSFGYDPVQTEKTIDDDCSGWGQVQTCYSVTRVTYPVLVYHPDHEAYKKEQLSGWDEYLKKNPWARMKPITGEAAKNLAALRWRHGRVAVADWISDEELKRVRWELGLDRKPEPTVQVIEPR
jgi:hypothetical protein